MTDARILSKTFVSSHPTEVAEILGDQPPAEVINFIGSLPPDLSGSLMARISSRILEDCLDKLPRAFLADVFSTCDHADAISILAHVQAASYSGILDAAKPEQKPALKRMFAFPQRTLASIAAPGFLRINEEQHCNQIKDELQSSDPEGPILMVVCNQDGQYQGLLSTEAVVSARNAMQPAREVMQRVVPLNGQTLIVTSLNAPQWYRNTILPVVDEEQLLLGIVSLEQLHNLVRDTEKVEYGISNLLQDTTIRYFNFCADLLGILAGNRNR